MADAKRGAEFLDAEIAKKPKLASPLSFQSEVRDLWRKGLPRGERTGWAGLDQHYTVAEGQLTIVTGWPGSGKSEFLDALLVNLAGKGWKIAMFSFENQPVKLHIQKLAEKLIGKPFGDGPNERMTLEELDVCTEELAESFAFADTSTGQFSVKDILNAAQPYLSQFDSKRGLVLDPWNEVEHWRPPNLSETEYVSQTLSMVRNWARVNRVHVWIVAHPQKIRREEGKLPVPRPDMISGSQHWWNKADACLTVFRDFDGEDRGKVEIHVQKVRFKHIGRPGAIQLEYDRVTGRYSEPFTVVYGRDNKKAAAGEMPL